MQPMFFKVLRACGLKKDIRRPSENQSLDGGQIITS